MDEGLVLWILFCPFQIEAVALRFAGSLYALGWIRTDAVICIVRALISDKPT